MKKRNLFCLIPFCTLLSGCGAGYQGFSVLTWLLGLPGTLLVVLAALRTRSIAQYNSAHPNRPLPKEHQQLSYAVLLAGLILMVLALITTYL